MPKKSYTCFEYTPEERKQIENFYDRNIDRDFPQGFPNRGKEFEEGETVRIKIGNIINGIAYCDSPLGQSILIQMDKELKGIRNLGYTDYNLIEGDVLDIVVMKDKRGTYYGSLSAGHENSIKSQLIDAMNSDDSAFTVKIESLCNGGFMVNLSGVRCFLPGSLAAANRIMDFSSYVGKNITVMVEMYDEKRDIFVVSFKKYLKKIIGSKVQDLSFTERYKGLVTGTAPNLGVFVEWDDIYTGLVSIDQFENISNIRTGEEILFWVSDIKNPNRIGLTIKEPSEKNKMLQEMKDVALESGENKIYRGEVSKVKTFGVFIKLENGFNGLIEKEELLGPINDYSPGQEVSCSVLRVDTSTLKIHLREL